jgi:cullin 1
MHPNIASKVMLAVGKVYELKVMFLVAWRDCVFEENFPLYDRAFDMVTRDRNGEKFNASLVRGLTQCFVDLGASETYGRDKLQIYREHFETSFLTDTEEYYRNEALEFLSQNSIPAYLTHVDGRLKEETARCAENVGSIHASTLDRLLESMQQVLLVEHAERIVSEIPPLLSKGQIAPLAAGYRLFKLIDPAMGLEPFKDTFQQHVVSVGTDEVAKTLVTKDGKSKADPQAYVEAILKVYDQYANIIAKAFNGDVTFTARLSHALRKFVNDNALTDLKLVGKSKRDGAERKSQESARLLVKFCDRVLTDKKIDDEVARSTLVDGAMRVFPFCESPDAFNTYYQKDLATRLLTGKSNADAERAVISSLKGQLGSQWSSKLQKMFEDEQLSKTLEKEYSKLSGRPREVAVSKCLVYTRNQWPLKCDQHRIKLPSVVEVALTHYKRFYTNKYQSKELHWQLEKSRAEISTVGLRGRAALTCSVHQMVILMMFNTKTASLKDGGLSIGDIVAQLDGGDGSAPYVHAVLETLCKFKLLEGHDKKKIAALPDTTKLTLNKSWKIKQSKLNINEELKVNGVTADQIQQDETAHDIATQRGYIVDGLMVKVMKSLAGKNITHVTLIASVADMLKSGNGIASFPPDARMLKNRIAHLIETEYIARVPGDAKAYVYKP